MPTNDQIFKIVLRHALDIPRLRVRLEKAIPGNIHALFLSRVAFRVLKKKHNSSTAYKTLIDDFSKLWPKKLRVGQWTFIAKMYLFLVLSGTAAMRLYLPKNDDSSFRTPPLDEQTSQIFRAIGATWGVGVLTWMCKTAGPWPFLSFTMQSWTLMTARYVLDFLGGANLGSFSEFSTQISETIRFPALMQNSLTVTVWWLILVPAFMFFTRNDVKKRKAFMTWNFSPFLINVHLLNLPLAAIAHLLKPRILTLHDMWIALVIGLSYLLFYLFILDPLGLHFYIVLSPRTKWSTLVYTIILGSIYGFYRAWNHALLEDDE